MCVYCCFHTYQYFQQWLVEYNLTYMSDPDMQDYIMYGPSRRPSHLRPLSTNKDNHGSNNTKNSQVLHHSMHTYNAICYCV
jgi:hypothetical protein